MRRRSSELIVKMVTVAILSALACVLMEFAVFPYPMAPWCTFDFSDTIVLAAYGICGFYGALSVAVIKTLFSLIYKGVGFMFVGQLAALVTSCCYLLGIFFFAHVLKWFKKGILFRILSYVLIVIFVAIVMTLCNFVFITPTFLAGRWATCFEKEIVDMIVSSLGNYASSYIGIISIIYLPFNFFKGLMVCAAYEAIFNTLIFLVIRNNPKLGKYFKNTKKEKIEEVKEVEENN